MKLNAIVGWGSKKDFWDLEALLQVHSLAQIIGFYYSKFSLADPGLFFRSLGYFDDAELEPDPIALDGKTWKAVKAAIIKAIRQSVK